MAAGSDVYDFEAPNPKAQIMESNSAMKPGRRFRLSGHAASCIKSGNFARKPGKLDGRVLRAKQTQNARQADDRQLLVQTNRRYRMLLDSASEGICVVDMAGNISFVNLTGADMLGYREAELLGKPFHETLHYLKPDGAHYPVDECPKHLALMAGVPCHCTDEMICAKDGRKIYADYTVAPIVENEKLCGAVISFKDISERKSHEQELAHQATHDALTGLANRTILSDRLDLLIERAKRKNGVVALLLLDLDRFKEINESLGHGAGDQLLRDVADRLAGNMRGSDTVGRMGGDEFIILTEVDEPDDAIPIAQKILGIMSQPFELQNQEVYVGVSIGVSLYPKDGISAEDLLKHGDAAMYLAKKQGRNTFSFYDGSMNASSSERLSMQSSLRRAVENGELLLHYQPQVNLQSGEIVGAEALVRWNHPEMGMVPPGRFIPMAEDTGLIFPIGQWVLHAACAQSSAWQKEGLPDMAIAVNLSAHQFRQLNLVKMTTGVLLETGLDGRFLELELTESAVMQDVDRVIRTLKELKATGVELSIDDFGTGYSSLSYLKQFAIDRLKIDHSFVRDITRDPNDAAITLAVITMAHSLGLNVIAEGVETTGQLDFLRSHGCDEMQGYYFSRPVPANEFECLLRDGKKLEFADQEGGSQRTLLLIDDDPNATAALRRLFRREGYRILIAHSAGEGFELLASNQVGVIISDQGMPDITGIEFLSRAKRLYPDVMRIVLSGYTDLKLVTDAFNRGAIYKFITKPWSDQEIQEIVRDAFREYSLRHPG